MPPFLAAAAAAAVCLRRTSARISLKRATHSFLFLDLTCAAIFSHRSGSSLPTVRSACSNRNCSSLFQSPNAVIIGVGAATFASASDDAPGIANFDAGIMSAALMGPAVAGLADGDDDDDAEGTAGEVAGLAAGLDVELLAAAVAEPIFEEIATSAGAL